MTEVIGNVTGIYQILNTVNGNCYIGKAINISARYKKHLSELQNNKHYNTHLQRAFNKYGNSSFKLNIIEVCTEDELNDREIYWIDFYRNKSDMITYNIMDGGNGGKIPDYIMEKARLKISKKAREGTYVRHIGEENGMYGKHHSIESKQKMGASKKGNVPWNKGKPWSDDVKIKISQALKGNKMTSEQRKHISDGHKGLKYNIKNKVWTDEYCCQVRDLHLQGNSFYKLGEIIGKSDETIRYYVRDYEKRHNLSNSSAILKNNDFYSRDDKGRFIRREDYE